MSLGLDRLKSGLQALQLKCGGTLEQRAQRLFAAKDITPENIDSSAYSKIRKKGKGIENTKKQREIAAIEAQVSIYSFYFIYFDGFVIQDSLHHS